MKDIKYGSGRCPDCGEELGSALSSWRMHNCLKKFNLNQQPANQQAGEGFVLNEKAEIVTNTEQKQAEERKFVYFIEDTIPSTQGRWFGMEYYPATSWTDDFSTWTNDPLKAHKFETFKEADKVRNELNMYGYIITEHEFVNHMYIDKSDNADPQTSIPVTDTVKEEDIRKENELVNVLKEYISFLDKECSRLFCLAHIHGYIPDSVYIEKGRELREKIKSLSSIQYKEETLIEQWFPFDEDIQQKTKNDLNILDAAYLNNVSEMSIYEERLIEQQNEIASLKSKIITLQQINETMLNLKTNR